MTEQESRKQHYESFERLAELAGVARLRRMVLKVLGLCCHADPEELVRRYAELDYNLNNISKARWKAQVAPVVKLFKDKLDTDLSQTSALSLLKHVARFHVAKLPVPE